MSAQNRNPLRQGWKAWVLLTGVGITVIGSLAIRSSTPPGSDAASTPGVVALPPERVAELGSVRPLELTARSLPRRGSMRVDGLPSMPTKPLFAAPVTRTRRS